MLVLGVAVAGIPKIRVGNSMVSYFRPGDPVMEGLKTIDETLAGTGSIPPQYAPAVSPAGARAPWLESRLHGSVVARAGDLWDNPSRMRTSP